MIASTQTVIHKDSRCNIRAAFAPNRMATTDAIGARPRLEKGTMFCSTTYCTKSIDGRPQQQMDLTLPLLFDGSLFLYPAANIVGILPRSSQESSTVLFA